MSDYDDDTRSLDGLSDFSDSDSGSVFSDDSGFSVGGDSEQETEQETGGDPDEDYYSGADFSGDESGGESAVVDEFEEDEEEIDLDDSELTEIFVRYRPVGLESKPNNGLTDAEVEALAEANRDIAEVTQRLEAEIPEKQAEIDSEEPGSKKRKALVKKLAGLRKELDKKLKNARKTRNEVLIVSKYYSDLKGLLESSSPSLDVRIAEKLLVLYNSDSPDAGALDYCIRLNDLLRRFYQLVAGIQLDPRLNDEYRGLYDDLTAAIASGNAPLDVYANRLAVYEAADGPGNGVINENEKDSMLGVNSAIKIIPSRDQQKRIIKGQYRAYLPAAKQGVSGKSSMARRPGAIPPPEGFFVYQDSEPSEGLEPVEGLEGVLEELSGSDVDIRVRGPLEEAYRGNRVVDITLLQSLNEALKNLSGLEPLPGTEQRLYDLIYEIEQELNRGISVKNLQKLLKDIQAYSNSPDVVRVLGRTKEVSRAPVAVPRELAVEEDVAIPDDVLDDVLAIHKRYIKMRERQESSTSRGLPDSVELERLEEMAELRRKAIELQAPYVVSSDFAGFRGELRRILESLRLDSLESSELDSQITDAETLEELDGIRGELLEKSAVKEIGEKLAAVEEITGSQIVEDVRVDFEDSQAIVSPEVRRERLKISLEEARHLYDVYITNVVFVDKRDIGYEPPLTVETAVVQLEKVPQNLLDVNSLLETRTNPASIFIENARSSFINIFAPGAQQEEEEKQLTEAEKMEKARLLGAREVELERQKMVADQLFSEVSELYGDLDNSQNRLRMLMHLAMVCALKDPRGLGEQVPAVRQRLDNAMYNRYDFEPWLLVYEVYNSRHGLFPRLNHILKLYSAHILQRLSTMILQKLDPTRRTTRFSGRIPFLQKEAMLVFRSECRPSTEEWAWNQTINNGICMTLVSQLERNQDAVEMQQSDVSEALGLETEETPDQNVYPFADYLELYSVQDVLTLDDKLVLGFDDSPDSPMSSVASSESSVLPEIPPFMRFVLGKLGVSIIESKKSEITAEMRCNFCREVVREPYVSTLGFNETVLSYCNSECLGRGVSLESAVGEEKESGEEPEDETGEEPEDETGEEPEDETGDEFTVEEIEEALADIQSE